MRLRPPPSTCVSTLPGCPPAVTRLLLLLQMVNSFSSNLFLALGAALRSDVMAQGLGAVALMMFANTCGFTIARRECLGAAPSGRPAGLL